MSKTIISIISGLLCVGVALPVTAQNLQNLPLRNPRQVPEGYISVQSGISLSYSVQDGDDEGQQEKALKSFYKVAASSCTTLLESIADACEITAMSNNTSLNNLDGRGQRLSISGQITISVKLKPSTAPVR